MIEALFCLKKQYNFIFSRHFLIIHHHINVNYSNSQPHKNHGRVHTRALKQKRYRKNKRNH